MTEDVVLELRGISRQFGAVRALTDVSFDCRAGEVHALVGENGSGKSTLLGVASGFVDPDLGSVQIGGRTLRTDSPAQARSLGLAMAYQDTSLIQAQPVKNNLYLAARPDQRPPYRKRKRWARRVLHEFDLDLELFPDAPAGMLTLAERQLFEVAKALVAEPKVLLLDEPTTALGPNEVEALHRTVAACRQRGVGVVYVSHRLPEVLEIADRITVLRDGRHQGTFDAATTSESAAGGADRGPAVRSGVPTRGRTQPRTPARRSSSTACRASPSARSTSRCSAGRSSGSPAPRATGNPSCSTASPGRQAPKAGKVVCAGKELLLISTHEAVRNGIMLLPGDRKQEALMPVLGVRVNATVQTLRRFSRPGLPATPRRATHRPGTGGSAPDPYALARTARAVPVGRQPAEGGGGAHRSCASPP